MQISNRMIKLLQACLACDDFVSVQSLANELNISRRTVFRELKQIESLLSEHDLQLLTKQGSGIKLEGSKENKGGLRLFLSAHSHGFMDRKERQQLLILELLKQKQLQKLFYYANKLKVSEATISNDLNSIEEWFHRHNLQIQRTPGIGVELLGEEEDYRKAITAALYEDVQDHVANTNISDDSFLDDALFQSNDSSILHLLDQSILKRIRKVLSQHRQGLQLFKYAQSSYIGLLIHLSVAIDRILKNEEIKGNQKILELVEDDQAFDQAQQLANLLQEEFSILIPKEEVAFIAMHLKGAKLRTVHDMEEEDKEDTRQRMYIITLIYRMIEAFDPDDMYHLKRDEEFIHGLYAHLRPTLVRLEHQLPIHNPLLEQLKEMYAVVYAKTLAIQAVFQNLLDMALPEAEVGFIAMHFGAALERLKHNDSLHRVVTIGVICSSGIGTSSLLSARIKSLFKAKVEVIALSASQLEEQETELDMLVSTFSLPHKSKPLLIVNPLLGKEDVTALEHLIASVPVSKKNVHARKGTTFAAQLKHLHETTRCMIEVLNNFCVVSVDDSLCKHEIIEFIGYRIGKSRESGLKVRNDILAREQLGSTWFEPYQFLLLHTQSEGVDQVQFQIYVPKGHHFTCHDVKDVRYLVVMIVPKTSGEAVRNVMSMLSRSMIEDDAYRLALHAGVESDIKSCVEGLLQRHLSDVLFEG